MSLTLYDLTIPIMVRQLETLTDVLKQGEQWAKDNNKPESELLEASIYEDMRPLTFQVQICSNTAKGCLTHIAGEEATPMEDNEKTFAELYARIEKTVKLLRAAKKEKFVGPDTKCHVKIGPFDAEFPALGYVQKFVLPNFFFHTTTAYDILRMKGVPVGKRVFLGSEDLTTWEL